MHKQYVVTMTTDERKAHEKICLSTMQILEEVANSIQDHNERASFWDKIRDFKYVSGIFKE